jgi:hypothetical protein
MTSRVAPAHCCAGAPSELPVRLSPQAAQASLEAARGWDARSPSHAAVKIRCRSRRTVSSWSRQSMASQRRASFAGPFTMWCPTCPPIPADMFCITSQLTCPRQRPFRGPDTTGPVSGQLSSNGYLEEQPRSLWFPVGFRLPAFASWASCSRQRIPPFLAVGLPDRRSAPGLCRGSRVSHV